MEAEQLQSGLKAILDEVLAVQLGEISQESIEVPDELKLIRVATFEEVGVDGNGVVIRTSDGKEWMVSICENNGRI